MAELLEEAAKSIQDVHINQSPELEDITPAVDASAHELLNNEVTEPSRSTPSAHHRRRHHGPALPPIPDLRFEPSYLAGLTRAQGSWNKAAWLTIRDQVIYPGLQGFGVALATIAFRSLILRQKESGTAWGLYIRDWVRNLVSTK